MEKDYSPGARRRDQNKVVSLFTIHESHMFNTLGKQINTKRGPAPGALWGGLPSLCSALLPKISLGNSGCQEEQFANHCHISSSPLIRRPAENSLKLTKSVMTPMNDFLVFSLACATNWHQSAFQSNSVVQGSENISFKRQDNKYFRLFRPYIVCGNYSTLLFLESSCR